MFFGDNKNKTGWTYKKINVLGEYYKYREKQAKLKPKRKGFYIIRDTFKPEWDSEEEKNG